MRIQSAKLLDRYAGRLVLHALRPLRALEDLRVGYRSLRAVREIVVVKLWGIGNAALLLPLLGSLRRRYPAAKLTVVTLRANRQLFQEAADRVLTVRMAPATQVMLYLAGARQILAFDTPGQRRAWLADVRVPYDDSLHMSESFLALFRAAGIPDREYRPGGVVIDAAAAERVDRWCTAAGAVERPLVLLHPGSGDNFPGRRWPARRFGLLARRVADETGAVVVVTGTDAEAPLARQVVEASERGLHDLSGKLTVEELVALIARAALYVSNDSGPVHLASALGVPVLGLYGPNTPRLYGPLAPGSVAFYDAPPCSPCITNFNYKTSRCRNPVCIRAIEVEDVAAAALRLLSSGRAERRA
ncbi:MAG: glycosyltransferase family 9 protein [Planctomycetota bacterium]